MLISENKIAVSACLAHLAYLMREIQQDKTSYQDIVLGKNLLKK